MLLIQTKPLLCVVITTILIYTKSCDCFSFGKRVTPNSLSSSPTSAMMMTMGCKIKNNRYSVVDSRNNVITSNSSRCTFQLHLSTTNNSNEQALNDDDDDDYHDHEIRELIISISLESDDVKRRKLLSETLEEKLNQEDVSAAAKFAHLWDVNIIKIGEQIQNEARAEAQNKADTLDSAATDSASDNYSEDDNDNDGNTAGSTSSIEKSMKEKQLWSMVDMMVQSKTLIKKLSTGGEK